MIGKCSAFKELIVDFQIRTKGIPVKSLVDQILSTHDTPFG